MLADGSETLGEQSLRAWNRIKGLRRDGNPGNKGGGRPKGSPNRTTLWTTWCQKLMLRKGTQRAIRRVMRDKSHPGHTAMIKMVRDSGFPVQKNLDVTMRTSLEDILAESYGDSE